MLTNDINLLNKALIHGVAAFKASNELISNLRECLNDVSDNDAQIICDQGQPGNSSANQSQLFPPSNNFDTSPFNVANSSFTPNSSAQFLVCTALEDIEMDVDDPMGMDEGEFRTSEVNVSQNEEINTNAAVNKFSAPPPTFEAVATALQQSLTSV